MSFFWKSPYSNHSHCISKWVAPNHIVQSHQCGMAIIIAIVIIALLRIFQPFRRLNNQTGAVSQSQTKWIRVPLSNCNNDEIAIHTHQSLPQSNDRCFVTSKPITLVVQKYLFRVVVKLYLAIVDIVVYLPYLMQALKLQWIQYHFLILVCYVHKLQIWNS